VVRLSAHLLSWIFHPLLILSYAYLLLMLTNPFAFGGHDFGAAFGSNGLQFFRVFQMTYLFPAFAVAMMRFLGLVDSLELRQREERYGPYIASGICYLWFFVNLNWGIEGFPPLFTQFVLGATIGLFLAFFLNIFTKVSAHTTGMGGFVCIGLFLYTQSYWSSPFWLVGIFLAAGAVGTARLLLNAHTTQEVYGGYLIGFGSQMIAFWFLGR
jgi:hypothetical protein